MESLETLVSVFESMDTERTGYIEATNLQQGLSNGTERPFNIKACNLMIAMFCKDGTRRIDFNQFAELWKFVNGWVSAFEASDVDGSGEITQPELNKLLNDLGYRLSDKFYTFIGKKFNLSGQTGLCFDDFLLICIILHMLTGVYSSLDYKRANFIELDYDQFLSTYLDMTSF